MDEYKFGDVVRYVSNHSNVLMLIHPSKRYSGNWKCIVVGAGRQWYLPGYIGDWPIEDESENWETVEPSDD